jgi:hypothetical protein
MSFCRAALIERLMNEPNPDIDSTEHVPVIEEISSRRGVWSDFSTCIKVVVDVQMIIFSFKLG